MDYSENKPIWPGSSSFSAGKTPFGFFDADMSFQSESDSFAKFAANHVGYPIMDVELIDIAAGSLIAQEGGALVSNFNGDPKFIDGNNIISATSKIYKSVLKSIKPYLEV